MGERLHRGSVAATALCFAALLSAPAAPAFAWGSEGHHIAAEIAEQFLEPLTAHQVRQLLAMDNETTLAQASTWADEIRPQRPETALGKPALTGSSLM
jgi:S1/P1 Nuclease